MNYLLLSILSFISLINYVNGQCQDSTTPITYKDNAPKTTKRSFYNHKFQVTYNGENTWYTLPYRVGVCNPAGYPTNTQNWVKYTCNPGTNTITRMMYNAGGCPDTNEMGAPMMYYYGNQSEFQDGGFYCAPTAADEITASEYYVGIEFALQSGTNTVDIKCKVDKDNDAEVNSIQLSIMTDVCFRFNANNATDITWNKIMGVRQNFKTMVQYYGQLQSFSDNACLTKKANPINMEDMCSEVQIQSKQANISLAIFNSSISVVCSTSAANSFSIMVSMIFIAVFTAIFA